jgi:putative ABC transport system substrate-binding protein
MGMQVQGFEARSPNDLDNTFATIAKEGWQAVGLIGSPMLFSQRVRIKNLAINHHLAMMCTLREYAEAGCLLSYGLSLGDLYRRSAAFVDKILKGAKPGDLPIEQPTKFELVINLKTAKALGLTIPPPLLLRADHVIE